MKKIVYTIITFTLSMLLNIQCDKINDFGDTNLNHETTESANTSALLTNVLSEIGEYSIANYYSVSTAIYCQYFSETSYVWIGLYQANPNSPMSYYSGILYDLQNIIINNTDDATRYTAVKNGACDNQIAIARILKAYIYWTITDRWGDVPYEDALNRDPNVNYDVQETIYKDLLRELTEAVKQFKSGPAILGDIVYNGDISKWKKFANSIRMLMSLRLSKRYPLSTDYAANQFIAALEDAAGSISTNEDNFQINYPGGNFRNFYYGLYNTSSGSFGECATMTTLLSSLGSDQRQTVFGSTATGEFSTLGVPVGINYPSSYEWCKEHSDYCYMFSPEYRKQTSPLYVITASHVLLARTEAADKGWTSETANTIALYQSGITQSFLQWGLAEPDATYFNGINVALKAIPGTGANLEQIATQQYIAFFPDGTQGWSNWRRTNFPLLEPAPDAVNLPPVIPRRFTYGPEDYALNKTGVEAAVARMAGGDRIDSRVWWDKEE